MCYYLISYNVMFNDLQHACFHFNTQNCCTIQRIIILALGLGRFCSNFYLLFFPYSPIIYIYSYPFFQCIKLPSFNGIIIPLQKMESFINILMICGKSKA